MAQDEPSRQFLIRNNFTLSFLRMLLTWSEEFMPTRFNQPCSLSSIGETPKAARPKVQTIIGRQGSSKVPIYLFHWEDIFQSIS
jgi:hypothetical protein